MNALDFFNMDEFQQMRSEIREIISRWRHIRAFGCNDPSWEDGANMNLVRNHFLYEKRKLREYCAEYGVLLPGRRFCRICRRRTRGILRIHFRRGLRAFARG